MPPFGQARSYLHKLRNFIAQKPGEDLPDIESAATAFVAQIIAIGRHGVAHVRAIVNGMGVSIVEVGGKTFLQRLSNTGLQRIIV